MPLVQRALKVLVDREVTPQLGLLKSTLLQLDSSFSERDYGVGSFREFADKLAKNGLVSLKHQGRSTLVELPDGSSADVTETTQVQPNGGPVPENLTEILEQPDSVPQPNASLGDGVALVRRVLAEAKTEPRWPMYPRQFKQFLRNAQPDFDERKYGSIADLMRACQKDGLLRLERDRQGALRVFGGGTPRAAVPHGWASSHHENGSDRAETSGNGDAPSVVDVVPEVIAAPIVDAQITAVVEDGVEKKPRRAARARKTAAPKPPTLKGSKSSRSSRSSKSKVQEQN